jgi:hypothetical protein
VLTWINKLKSLCPLTALSLELVKFDTQLLDNPDIADVEYQQGELQGYEVREYLLDKWGRACAYCQKKELPLQVEHIVPVQRAERTGSPTCAWLVRSVTEPREQEISKTFSRRNQRCSNRSWHKQKPP